MTNGNLWSLLPSTKKQNRKILWPKATAHHGLGRFFLSMPEFLLSDTISIECKQVVGGAIGLYANMEVLEIELDEGHYKGSAPATRGLEQGD